MSTESDVKGIEPCPRCEQAGREGTPGCDQYRRDIAVIERHKQGISEADYIESLQAENERLREKNASLDQDLSDAGDELRAVWDVLGKISYADAEQLHADLADSWQRAGREGEVKSFANNDAAEAKVKALEEVVEWLGGACENARHVLWAGRANDSLRTEAERCAIGILAAALSRLQATEGES